jgi:hypothetical protein
MPRASNAATREAYRPLTPKQREFVLAWIVNGGNGTKAAISAYCCSTVNGAAVCASRLLRNVNIQAAIEAEMYKQGLSADKIVRAITGRLDAEPLAIRLKAVEMLLKLIG